MRGATFLLLRMDRRRLASVAGAVLAVACLVFLGYLLFREREALATLLITADPRQLVPIVFWYLADLLIYIAGWALIMARLGGRAGFATHVRIFCLANAAKRLPGTVWYIGGRAALYDRIGIPARVVVTASAIEGALIWLSSLAISIPFLMAFLPDRGWVWFGGGLLLVGLLNPWALRWLLNRAMRGSALPSISWARVYGWLAVYGAGWAVGGVLLFTILRMFHTPSVGHLPMVIGGWAIAGTASMLTFFLPSGFGVTEVTLTVLLSQIAPMGAVVLTAVGARLITTVLDMIFGGLAYLSLLSTKHK